MSGNVVHREVSHQKHSEVLLPEEGVREASGHRVLLATMPRTSQALEKPCEVQRLVLEKPGAEQELAVPAHQN